MSQTFKVGDRVFYVDNGEYDAGTVTGFDSDGDVYVHWDDESQAALVDSYAPFELARVPEAEE